MIFRDLTHYTNHTRIITRVIIPVHIRVVVRVVVRVIIRVIIRPCPDGAEVRGTSQILPADFRRFMNLIFADFILAFMNLILADFICKYEIFSRLAPPRTISKQSSLSEPLSYPYPSRSPAPDLFEILNGDVAPSPAKPRNARRRGAPRPAAPDRSAQTRSPSPHTAVSAHGPVRTRGRERGLPCGQGGAHTGRRMPRK